MDPLASMISIAKFGGSRPSVLAAERVPAASCRRVCLRNTGPCIATRRLKLTRHTTRSTEASDAEKQTVEEDPTQETDTSGHRPDLNLLLVHPQIPQNAGNVARTAAATGVALHLVEPLGFDIDDKKLKRAGLDYWPFVVVKVHKSWEDFYAYFQSQPDPKRLMAFSKFGTVHYAAPDMYREGDWLMFGSEIDGLPPEAHQAAVDSEGQVVKIPMQQVHVRSLNLSVSAGVGLYEAIRQIDQPNVDTAV